MLASIVAIRKILKNPTTSVTPAGMMEEDCGPAAIIKMII
jgi:hypothetical protein